MYTHQVIDDLNETINSEDKYHHNYNKRLLMTFINDIQQSQKFHFGKVSDVLRASGEKDFSNIKYFFNPRDAKPPYLITWLDYNLDGLFMLPVIENLKMGMLIMEDDEICRLFPFICLDYLSMECSPNTERMYRKWIPCQTYLKYEMGMAKRSPTFSIHRNILYKEGSLDESSYRSSIDHYKTYLVVFSLFLTFLSCKNIETQENPPPLKLNKKRQKTGKQPLFTYKTLVLKPTGKKQESQAAQGLWDNRVHLCRGHFKEYTAKKPLFGRITGRFWWQPSVRGRSRDGIVMKNYKIEA